MNFVNRYFIDDVLGPLSGLADSDEDVNLYQHFQSNEENQVKALFSEIIKPAFDLKNDMIKIKTRDALAFYLVSDKINFASIFHSNLLPFNLPHNPKLFFIWLWEVLFSSENYKEIDVNNFKENNDVDEPWRMV